MRRTVIVSYARTPFGRLGGSLSKLSAVDLGAEAIRFAYHKTMLPMEKIDLVIMGQVISAGCGQLPARQSSIKAGISESVPVEQINKVCASSLRAVTLGDQIIRCGDADTVIAGGMESMSNAPYSLPDLRWGHKMFNTEIADLMVKDGLWCPIYDRHMAVHGGEVAKEYEISREEQDLWAVRSQERALAALESGDLNDELVELHTSDGILLKEDETPRQGVTVETLAKLRPIFCADNTVTAGNAPGVNDGASAMMLMEEKAAERERIPLEAIVLSHTMVAEDPKNIATAPGRAILKLLDKTGISINDIDLFEINEAFAAVVLVSSKIAGCPLDKVNVRGGAIAYGHPLGASGGRILMTLVRELRKQNLRYGIAAICSGTGQGDAILVENPKFV